ncbi:MAG: ABC transporter ATP-binding protein [Prolixibacteraceae bacterium]|nr:ABC transporter ATP-binding protein [Prolixibacteraceae bacterium]MBN2650497.1 ABC transporter ATP-binding protein [Prolixibacteraceae bacterium]
MKSVIQITNLKKTFQNGNEIKHVLKGIDLTVTPGQIIGYIGPNGAGKSTTVKIMCGLLDSYSGEVLVNGINIKNDPVLIKSQIGYIPESADIYESITPIEFFTFIAEMRQLNVSETMEKAKRLLTYFEIEDTAHQRVGSFSKGMKQKVLIISALLHNPQILFMDEPLSGLDANSVIKVKEMITQMAREGKTIFYSSHLMDVVEKVSNRIILLHDGKIIADGTFEELKAESHDESLEKMFARLTGHHQLNQFELNPSEN